MVRILVVTDENLESVQNLLVRYPNKGKEGNLVMVGIEETNSQGVYMDVGNHNRLSGHFVVLNAINNNNNNGVITVEYLDNAGASVARRPNENLLNVDLTAGSMTDVTNLDTNGYDSYEVTEVRKNE